jgi:predicted amidohydrolase YtcJ
MLHDDEPPGADELTAIFTAAHAVSRPVAVHCVTRVQLLLALAAFDAAGARPGDRIEHGAVVPPQAIDELRRFGLVVVVQPNFVAERGDAYLADVDPADLDDLHRNRSLLAAGVTVAAGTDAPFGRPDPWAAIAAAVERRTPSGVRLGGAERVSGRQALGQFLGRLDSPGIGRRVAVGERADLCLVSADIEALLAAPSADAVAATVVDGEVRFRRR